MYSTPTLATRFARNTRVLRTDSPLSEDQMRAAAPSAAEVSRQRPRCKQPVTKAWQQLLGLAQLLLSL